MLRREPRWGTTPEHGDIERFTICALTEEEQQQKRGTPISGNNNAAMPSSSSSTTTTLLPPYLTVSVITYGGILQSVQLHNNVSSMSSSSTTTVEDHHSSRGREEGRKRELILGFSTLEGYINDDCFIGGSVGRYANRIGGGGYHSAAGEFVPLSVNEGASTILHGGKDGFHKRVWTVHSLRNDAEQVSVTLRLISPHLDQGFHGTLLARVEYCIVKKAPNTLRMTYTGELLDDEFNVQTSLCNLTNHAYWNLCGSGVPASSDTSSSLRAWPSVEDHTIQLNSKYYVAVDERNIPTGEVLLNSRLKAFASITSRKHPTEEGRVATTTVREANALLVEEVPGHTGIDHCFVVDSRCAASSVSVCRAPISPQHTHQLDHIATLSSGSVTADVYSNMPGVQLYTGNFIHEGTPMGPHPTTEKDDDDDMRSGCHMTKRCALCLETQLFPDAPNQPPHFLGASAFLRRGRRQQPVQHEGEEKDDVDRFYSVTEWCFSTQ